MRVGVRRQGSGVRRQASGVRRQKGESFVEQNARNLRMFTKNVPAGTLLRFADFLLMKFRSIHKKAELGVTLCEDCG
jgi:hypothetical protein